MSANPENPSPNFEVASASSNVASPSPVALEEGNGRKKEIFIESDAGDGSRREQHYLHGVKLVLCLLSLYFSLFLVALDQTIIVTLLSEVGNKFNALEKVGWLASGFLLAMAVFAATWGKISVIFGRKYTLVIAIVLFEAGSLMCALANDMNVLIGGRVLAGVGGGGIQSLVFIIVSEIVPIEKRPLTMAFVGCVFAVASVLGPLVGGAFTSHVSWRWCFYINLPIGAVALAFLFFAFNPPKPQGNLKTKLKLIDYIGTILLTIGIVLFLLALTFGSSTYAWNSSAVISCFVLGVSFMLFFGVWNFRFSKSQIMPTEVVIIPQVMASVLTIHCMFAYFMASALYLSVYFQVVWGADAWHSGIHLLPMIIPVVIASISGGVLISKTKFVKPFAIIGGMLGPIGTGLLTLLDEHSSNGAKIGLLIIVGASCGIQMQSSMISSQISAPKTPGGTIMATVMVNLGRALGGAIGSILADTVYNTSLKNLYRENIRHVTDQAVLKELSRFDVAQLSSSSTTLDSLSPGAREFVLKQISHSMRNVFYMCLGYAILAFIFGLFTTNKKLPDFSSGAATASESKDVVAKDAIEETTEDEEDEEKVEKKVSNSEISDESNVQK